MKIFKHKLLNKARREKVNGFVRKTTALVAAFVMAFSTFIGSLAPTVAYAASGDTTVTFPNGGTAVLHDDGTITGSCQLTAGWDAPYATETGDIFCASILMPDGQTVTSLCYETLIGDPLHNAYVAPGYGTYDFTATPNGDGTYSVLVHSDSATSAFPGHNFVPGYPAQRMYAEIWKPVLTGTLSIQKVTGDGSITDGNGAYSLANAVYGIYSNSGCTSLVETMTTDGSGAAQSGNLEVGTYYVKEITPSSGYALDPNTYTVQVSAGQNSVVNGGTVSEPPLNDPTGLWIHKVDTETGQGVAQGDASLAGAQYTYRFFAGDSYYEADDGSIVNSAGETVMDAEGNFVGDEADRTWVVETDEDGYASLTADYLVSSLSDDLYYSNGIETLPIGTVVVRETAAPTGYLVSDDVYVMRVTDGGGVVASDGDINIVDGNRYIGEGAGNQNDEVGRGGVKLRKVDRELDESLPLGAATLEGARIAITNDSENAVLVGGVSYDPGEVVMYLTTDENGECSTADDALPYGTYTATEVVAPEGYLLNSDWSQTFEIRYDGQMVDLTGLEHAVDDQVIRGDIEFVKVDGLDMDRLAGIPFLVTSQTTGESHVIVTDANGEVSTAADWNAHTSKTNANDAAVTWNDDGTYTVDESLLDDTAGVWFNGRTDRTTTPDDSLGALPYDTYTFQELRVSANEDFDLVSFNITISRNNHVVDGGTVDNNYLSIGTTATAVDGGKYIGVGESATVTDTVAYEGLTPGDTYKLVGTLMDKETGEAVTDADGAAVTSTVEFTPVQISGEQEVEFTFDTTGIAGHDVVVFEELYNAQGDLIASHEDIDDEGQTVQVGTPEIGTTASGTDGKQLSVGESVTLTDTVSYSGLNPGETYTVEGTVHVRGLDDNGDAVDDGVLTDADGNEVRVSAEFTPESNDGTVEVTFTIDTTELAGKELVVFEKVLTANGTVVGTHEDIDDEGQTVEVATPEIGTTATSADGDKNVLVGENVTLTDTVSYSGLNPGEVYTVEGTVMDKETGEAVTDAEGNAVTSTVEFTPETSSGTVEVTFTIDTTELAGKELVVFEKVLTANGTVVGTHEDIDDEGQTVEVTTPEIGTTATSADGDKSLDFDYEVTLVDTVEYSGLNPGETYTVEGTVMDKETGEALTFADGSVAYEVYDADSDEWVPLATGHTDNVDGSWTQVSVEANDDGTWTVTTERGTADSEETVTDSVTYASDQMREVDVAGEPVTATAEFTPEASSGTVEVSFTFNTTTLGGKELVVFENVYSASGTLVASHEDIDDAGQTVAVDQPAIGTELTDSTDGDHEATPSTTTTLIDTVTYTGLVPGRSYRVEGVLMNQSTGEPILVNDQEVTAETTFVPNQSDGTVELAFTFDSTGLDEGTNVVAFEHLYYDDLEIATHADISDMGQTVEITSTPDGKVLDKTGVDAGTIAAIVAAAAIIVAALVGYGLYQKRKGNAPDDGPKGDGSSGSDPGDADGSVADAA